MLTQFASFAIRFMKDHYGNNFIINFDLSDDTRICFDQKDKSGKRFLRKYLSIPAWLGPCNTVEVIQVFDDLEVSFFDEPDLYRREQELRIKEI